VILKWIYESNGMCVVDRAGLEESQTSGGRKNKNLFS
jgi:hypothetical protein